MLLLNSPALRHVRANSGITFRPDANTVMWLPGQDDPQSSVIRDRSGNGNDGSLTGTTWARNAKGLWYQLFDGIANVTSITPSASVNNFWDGGATVLIWINPFAAGGYTFHKLWIISVAQEAAGKLKLNLFLDFDGAADGTWQSTATAVSLNAFSLIAISYDSDDVANNPIFCINGTELTVGSGISELTTPQGARIDDTATPLTIGNHPNQSVPFSGGQALHRVSSTLTTSQIAGIYRQERGLFGV